MNLCLCPVNSIKEDRIYVLSSWIAGQILIKNPQQTIKPIVLQVLVFASDVFICFWELGIAILSTVRKLFMIFLPVPKKALRPV